MINVSTEFRERMKERTDFRCFAELTLTDGRELTLGAGDFTMGGNSVTDGPGAEGLPLGAAVCRTARLSLANRSGELDGYDFYGAKLRLYLTFPLSETEERIELGTFTVTEPESRGETVTVTAADGMYRTDRAYTTALSFPATLGAMFREICDGCGVPYSTAEFANSGFAVREPPGEGYTCRQVLGYIAMLAGGNARVHRDGRMEILSYDPEKAPEHDLTDWITLTPDTDDVTVTGLETTDGSGNKLMEGSEGYVLAVEDPLMAGQEAAALAAMGARLIGLRVRRFQGEYIGYPLAECMDTARIADRRGNAFETVLTDVTFVFGGRTALSDSAAPAVRNASRYATPETRARQAALELVAAERTAREAAVAALNERLAKASGMYGTEQRQPDGSSVWYLHDKPELGQSQAVMKLTSEAIGFSTDGGKTYPFGFTVTGEMVMGIIRSEGISADWVKVGGEGLGAVLEGFVGRDENDQIVSMLNASADQINIRGNRFVLDSDNFKVAADGTVTAKNADIQGKVRALELELKTLEETEDGETVSKMTWIQIRKRTLDTYGGYEVPPKPGPVYPEPPSGYKLPEGYMVLEIGTGIGIYTPRVYADRGQFAYLGGKEGSFEKLIATYLGANQLSENGTLLVNKYLSLSGGRLRGPLNIGDFLTLYSDTEGGNINIHSPAKYGNSWEIDAFDGNLRIVDFEAGGKSKVPLTLNTGGNNLNVGGKVNLYTDGEGGNIGLTGSGGRYWEIDANGDDLRFLTFWGSDPIFPLVLRWENPGESYFAGTANRVSNPLTFTGSASGSYDGSAAKSVNIPPAVAVKGDRETNYRTGNVNLTPGNIGAVSKTGDTMTGDLTVTNSSQSARVGMAIGSDGKVAGLYSSNYSTWLINCNANGHVYVHGKPAEWWSGLQLPVPGATLNGYITSSAKEIILQLPVGRPITAAGVTVTKLTGVLRGVNGYVQGSSDINFLSGYTVSAYKTNDAGLVWVHIEKSSAFSGAVNNTPIVFKGDITVSFTATADEPMPGPEIFDDGAAPEGPSVEDVAEPTEKEAETV